MYRPNEIEEQRILELAQWIEKAKEDSTYSSYVIGKISGHIKLAWEHFRYRHELCSSDFETTKQNLLNKYSEEGRFRISETENSRDKKDNKCRHL